MTLTIREKEANYMDKKIISFEASAELKEALRVKAFRENISISALIRQILEESLRSQEFKKEH